MSHGIGEDSESRLGQELDAMRLERDALRAALAKCLDVMERSDADNEGAPVFDSEWDAAMDDARKVLE